MEKALACIDSILTDSAFSPRVQVLVGPHASREELKNVCLEKKEILGGSPVSTISAFATELSRGCGVRMAQPLGTSSQADALQLLAKQDLLRKMAPQWAQYLKKRTIAKKTATIISSIDHYYSNQTELEILIEYFHKKNPEFAQLLTVLSAVWSQGELKPWTEYESIRTLLSEQFLNLKSIKLPSQIWLWGFKEWTPLEERFIEWLSKNTEVVLLWPSKHKSHVLSKTAQSIGIKLQDPGTLCSPRLIRFWNPHSFWDELGFLSDYLRENINTLAETVVFLPATKQPELHAYYRILCEQLEKWNVPFEDLIQLPSASKKPEWLWWIQFLKTIAGALKESDVRAFLSFGNPDPELFNCAFQKGIHQGAKNWKKVLQLHPNPELTLLLEGAFLFHKTLSLDQFEKSLNIIISKVNDLLGKTNSDFLIEFCEHLNSTQRPYLSSFKGRLNRYIPLLEEYLEQKLYSERTRSTILSLTLAPAGSFLAKSYSQALFLGTNFLPKKKNQDQEIIDETEIRKAWGSVHASEIEQEDSLLEELLTGHEKVIISTLSYDLNGKDVSVHPVVKRVFEKESPRPNQYQFDKMGGHYFTGWNHLLSGQTRKKDVIVSDWDQKNTLRVSAFEDYLKCPFLFFARHVARLEPDLSLGLEADARSRGNIIHKVLENVISLELEGKLEIHDLEAVNRQVDEVLAKQPIQGYFASFALRVKTENLLKNSIRNWIEWEIENRNKHPDLKPFVVEEEVSIELIPGLRLTGKVDRVDRCGNAVLIIDYKTGDGPFVGKELVHGLGAQLLVYTQGIAEKHGLDPAGAFYLTVGKQVTASKGIFVKRFNKKLFTARANNSGLIDEYGRTYEQALEYWTQAAENLKAGVFTAMPARPKKDCPYCLYQRMCGYKFHEQETVD